MGKSTKYEETISCLHRLFKKVDLYFDSIKLYSIDVFLPHLSYVFTPSSLSNFCEKIHNNSGIIKVANAAINPSFDFNDPHNLLPEVKQIGFYLPNRAQLIDAHLNKV